MTVKILENFLKLYDGEPWGVFHFYQKDSEGISYRCEIQYISSQKQQPKKLVSNCCKDSHKNL